MKKLCILSFLLLLFNFSFAQHMEFAKKTMFSFEVRGGGLIADFDNMNAVLNQSGFEGFDQGVANFKFMFNKRYKNFPIGTHFGFNHLRALNEKGEKFNPDDQTFNSRTLRSGGLTLGFDIYAVDKKWFGVSPYVDFDFNKTTLKLHEGIPPDFSLGNTPGSGLKTSRFTNGDIMSEIGLNLDFRFPIRGIGHTIGVSGGYRLDLLKNNWRYDDDLDVSFPDFSWTGWQFAVKVGIELRGHGGKCQGQQAPQDN
ncbi:MAG: hypothetical protein R2830_05015 [Saprospiraceae bacterium]